MILVFFIFPNLVLIRINAISIAFLYVITYNYHNCWDAACSCSVCYCEYEP